MALTVDTRSEEMVTIRQSTNILTKKVRKSKYHFRKVKICKMEYIKEGHFCETGSSTLR